MVYTYRKTFFVVYLKFKVNWALCVLFTRNDNPEQQPPWGCRLLSPHASSTSHEPRVTCTMKNSSGSLVSAPASWEPRQQPNEARILPGRGGSHNTHSHPVRQALLSSSGHSNDREGNRGWGGPSICGTHIQLLWPCQSLTREELSRLFLRGIAALLEQALTGLDNGWLM